MINHGITDLRKLSAQKNKVHRKAKRTNSPADWEKFRRVRNQYTEKIREASSTYRANLAPKLNEGVTITSPGPNHGGILPDSSWVKLRVTKSLQ